MLADASFVDDDVDDGFADHENFGRRFSRPINGLALPLAELLTANLPSQIRRGPSHEILGST
jgi:hypothetical protein